jgi:hypothetical protein
MKKYEYLGGIKKVSLHCDTYSSFEYPSDTFKSVLRPVYKIGYEVLGQRQYEVTRCLKKRNEILKKLGV